MDDKVITWLLCGGLDGNGGSLTIAEFKSKPIADHVAKTHNRAVRKR